MEENSSLYKERDRSEKMREAMIAWNRETEEIRVGPWPDQTGWSKGYSNTHGVCMSFWRELDDTGLALMIFITFCQIVVRDSVPPRAAHAAFLEIDEYRERLSPDVPGLTPR